MRINIYYGGRGATTDPTIRVLNKMEVFFKKSGVDVVRYHLGEEKNGFTALPQTLEEADGIILAASVEWFGIGGLLHQFLDAVWLYGSKEKIKTLVMQPIVMSNTYGEREGMLTLIQAWDILGGKVCNGLSGYVDDLEGFEANLEYALLIEETAKHLYQTISENRICLPVSNGTARIKKIETKQTPQTFQATRPTRVPQKTVQIAQPESYSKKQKEDVEELTNILKQRLGEKNYHSKEWYLEQLKLHFVPKAEVQGVYEFTIKEKSKPLIIVVHNEELSCYYGEALETDIKAKFSQQVFEEILAGRMTFQKAFLSGEMVAKGDFKTLRMLDQIFVFTE